MTALYFPSSFRPRSRPMIGAWSQSSIPVVFGSLRPQQKLRLPHCPFTGLHLIYEYSRQSKKGRDGETYETYDIGGFARLRWQRFWDVHLFSCTMQYATSVNYLKHSASVVCAVWPSTESLILTKSMHSIPFGISSVILSFKLFFSPIAGFLNCPKRRKTVFEQTLRRFAPFWFYMLTLLREGFSVAACKTLNHSVLQAE